MRTKGKAILLCLAAMFAASAMACSSASALSNEFFEAGSKAIATEHEVVGKAPIVIIHFRLAHVQFYLICEKAEDIQRIRNGMLRSFTWRLRNCVLYVVVEGKAENITSMCPIKEPIESTLKGELFTQTKAGVVAANMEPMTGSTLFEMKIGGSNCTTTGNAEKTYKVEGSYSGSFGGQGEELRTEHELAVEEGGNNVKVEGEPATITYTEGMGQTSGKEWYVD